MYCGFKFGLVIVSWILLKWQGILSKKKKNIFVKLSLIQCIPKQYMLSLWCYALCMHYDSKSIIFNNVFHMSNSLNQNINTLVISLHSHDNHFAPSKSMKCLYLFVFMYLMFLLKHLCLCHLLWVNQVIYLYIFII